jgi:hypothetical protein
MSGGHDASEIIHKDPATVYHAFDDAFSGVVEEGNNGEAAAKGQISTIDKVPGKSIDIKVNVEGKQAVRLRFTFAPSGSGDTKTTADIDVDRAILRAAVKREKGSDAAFPAIPDFALNLAMQQLLHEAAAKIEKGEPLETPRSTYAMAGGSNYSTYGQADWGRQYREQESMRKATAPTASASPMMDPDQAAREYMGSHSSD